MKKNLEGVDKLFGEEPKFTKREASKVNKEVKGIQDNATLSSKNYRKVFTQIESELDDKVILEVMKRGWKRKSYLIYNEALREYFEKREKTTE